MDLLGRCEEVCHFGLGQVCEAGDLSEGDDEHVAWDDGFVVDEGVGEGCFVEDLGRVNFAVVYLLSREM